MEPQKRVVVKPLRRLAFKHWKTAKDVERLEVSQNPKDVLHDTDRSLVRVGRMKFKDGRTRNVAVKFFKHNPVYSREYVETPVTDADAVILQGRIAKIAKMFPELPKMGMHKLPSGEWVLVSEFFARKATPEETTKRMERGKPERRWKSKLKGFQEGGLLGGYNFGWVPINPKTVKRFAAMYAELINANIWGMDIFEILSTKTVERLIPFDVIQFYETHRKSPGKYILENFSIFFTELRNELNRNYYNPNSAKVFVSEFERRLQNPRLLMLLRGDFQWFATLHGVKPEGLGEYHNKLVYGSREFHSYMGYRLIRLMGGPDWWYKSNFHRLGVTPTQLSQYLHLKFYEEILGSPGYEPEADELFQAINPLKLRKTLPRKLKEIPVPRKLLEKFNGEQEINLNWSQGYHHFFVLNKNKANPGN